MICASCGNIVSHIKAIDGIERCSYCSGLGENRSTDDLITRSSSRIRMEALKYEGDLLAPRKYDKASKKIVANEDFLKINKERSKNFFSADELNEQGYGKLTEKIVKFDKEVKSDAAKFKADVEHTGVAGTRVKELLNEAI